MQINKTSKRVRIGFIVALLFILILVVFSYKNAHDDFTENKTLHSSVSKVKVLKDIINDIELIEQGEQNYLNTGDAAFLKDYERGIQQIKKDSLNFIPSNIKSKVIFDSLKLLLNNKIWDSKSAIEKRKSLGIFLPKEYHESISDLVIMNNIRTTINNLETDEWENINKAERNNFILANQRNNQLLFIATICLFCFFSLYLILQKNFKLLLIKEKELKFKSSLINQLSDAIITTDELYNIVSWNKYAEEVYGYNEKEVLGLNYFDLANPALENEDIQTAVDDFLSSSNWKGEVIHHTKAGKKINVDFSTTMLYDEKGIQSGSVTIVRDITLKKTTAGELNKLTKELEKEVERKVTEQNIVFDRITDAFIALDNDWNYTYINKKAASLYNMPAEEMIGKNIWKITPQIADHEFYNEMMRAKENQLSTKIELFHPKTGQWFEDWIYPDQNGVSVYYREITNRKINEQNISEARKALEIANERFELVTKATNDAIWDWKLGTETLWGNDAFLKLMEIDPTKEINYNELLARIVPDDLKKYTDNFAKTIANKVASLTNEFSLTKLDGTSITIFDRANILYNSEGAPFRIIGALQDITIQKQIQKQIIHEKELSEVLINSLPGIFYMFNKSGKFIRWNKNILNITGYTAEEMKNLNPIEFVPEDQRALLSEKIMNVFNYGIDNAETTLLTKNNSKIPYYFTGIYIKYEGEDCMMGVGIDITDRVNYQEQLRELAIHLQNIREEERTRIAREIHDELGQQLTGLKMDISWLSKKIVNETIQVNEKFEDTLLLIDETVKTVRKISTQLRPSILDDLGLVSAMEWQSEEFQKRFNIISTFISNKPLIELDSSKSTAIFRIYQECLTNVLRHSQATSVATTIEIHNGILELKITDNGIGFNQTENENKKTLGLLGMKERALIFGGTYQTISEINKGTTILVKLPLDV